MNKLSKGLIAFAAVFSLCFLSAEDTQKSEAAATKVMVGGSSIGLRLYLDGLLVVGESDILSGSVKSCPGKNAGIQKGDRITKINGEEISDAVEFCNKIQENGSKELVLEVVQSNNLCEKRVTPVYYNDTGEYKIGLWVRDSTAGIGTITYVLSDGSFCRNGQPAGR